MSATKKRLPHGTIPFERITDRTVRDTVMKLNENIVALQKRLGEQGSQGPFVPVDTTFNPMSGNPATSAAIASWGLAKNLSNLEKQEACVISNYPMPTNVTASITGSGTFGESGWVYIRAIVGGQGAYVGISVGTLPYVSYADYAGSSVTLLVPVVKSNTYNVFTNHIQDGSLSIIFIKNVANAI